MAEKPLSAHERELFDEIVANFGPLSDETLAALTSNSDWNNSGSSGFKQSVYEPYGSSEKGFFGWMRRRKRSIAVVAVGVMAAGTAVLFALQGDGGGAAETPRPGGSGSEQHTGTILDIPAALQTMGLCSIELTVMADELEAHPNHLRLSSATYRAAAGLAQEQAISCIPVGDGAFPRLSGDGKTITYPAFFVDSGFEVSNICHDPQLQTSLESRIVAVERADRTVQSAHLQALLDRSRQGC